MSEGTILQYFPKPTTPSGESLLDFTTKKQIAIKPALLPLPPLVADSDFASLFSPISVRDYREEGIRDYSYDRNEGGANVDHHQCSISVPINSLSLNEAIPIDINQKTRHPLLNDREFAGYTEHEYHFTNVQDGLDNRLDHNIKVLHIPSNVSPIVETIEIQRHVSDQYGMFTYATINFNNKKEIMERLGVSTSRHVFVTMTPYGIYAITYGEQIIKELTVDDLERAGVKAKFEDGQDKAELMVSAGNLIFHLTLNKKLRPEYERIMFDENEQWITDSEIEVLSVPKEVLN